MDSQKLAQAFVELADSLVDDFDALTLLNVLVERCIDVLDVAAAGVLFADGHDELRVIVSSSESARLLELYQLQDEEGPCFECYHSGRPVSAPMLEQAQDRWPRFATAAIREGFSGVLAVPMRLRDRMIGGLNLFDTKEGTFSDPSIYPIAQAMADVATIAILQERVGTQREVLNEQLQDALTSRVVIEQAKGVLATGLGIEMDAAFELMRQRSRNERRALGELAEEVAHARSPEAWAAYRGQ